VTFRYSRQKETFDFLEDDMNLTSTAHSVVACAIAGVVTVGHAQAPTAADGREVAIDRKSQQVTGELQ